MILRLTVLIASSPTGIGVAVAPHSEATTSGVQSRAERGPITQEEVVPTGEGSGEGAYSALYGISCPAVLRCVSVGIAYSSEGPGILVENLSGSTWTPEFLGVQGLTEPYLDSIWCASVNLCVAVGNDQSGPIARTHFRKGHGLARQIADSKGDLGWDPSGCLLHIHR